MKVIVINRIVNAVEEYLPKNDQLMTRTLEAKPVNLHILQVYMLTSNSPDNEVQKNYT